MKISICSDLHLEFGDIQIKNNDGASVLILSGDIMTARHPKLDFLEQCSKEFDQVLYVAGNHEFYNYKWYETNRVLREVSYEFENVHFMENSIYRMQDVLFIGATLWTDMNKYDPITIQQAQSQMNDYRLIRNDRVEYRKIRPIDTIARHNDSVIFIRDVLHVVPSDTKVVVLTHHAPTKMSVHPHYTNNYHMNGAYSSDLSNLILDNPQIKLWTHGHTHEPFDYMVGSTRVVCNPRGYDGYEHLANNFELKTVEI